MAEKIITVDIGASKIKIQTVDKNGNFDPENLISIVESQPGNEEITEFLVKGIEPLINGDADNKIIAISIGGAGQVNSNGGVIKTMPNIPGVENLHIVEKLKERFNLPVFLLNDADAGALGEHWLGNGQNFEKMIYLTLGTGVGSGIIFENKLQSGSELGRKPLAIEGEERICAACDRLNCAEAFLGTKGLAGTYARILSIKKDEMTPGEEYSISIKMKTGVSNGETNWLKVEDEYSNHLAIFITAILSLYRPDTIVIGGGIAFNDEHLLDITIKKIKTEGVRIVLAKFSNAVNMGAAKFALDNLS